MKYRKDMVFYKLRSGSRVEKVPLDHPVFWTAINRPRGTGWLNRMKQIKKFPPVYYCKNCRQIEDGAHRIKALYEQGKKYCDVKIHKECIHKNTGYWGILEASLKKVEKEGVKLHRLDYAWLEACKNKWKSIDKVVNFRNKTVLDIGCQCGYSPMEAVRRGAKLAIGIDIREEVLRAGKWAAYDILKYGFDKIILAPGKWEDYKVKKQDIVICLALLHYFPIDKYAKLFKKILNTTKETVIIELRLYHNDNDRLAQRGTQTLPSTGWLHNRFGESGFKVIHKTVRKLGERELWIAERK